MVIILIPTDEFADYVVKPKWTQKDVPFDMEALDVQDDAVFLKEKNKKEWDEIMRG